MRSAGKAQWVLELVLPSNRAASMVGDLVEEQRGALWFWACITETFTRSLWEQLRAEPLRMACLGIVGLAFAVAANLIVLIIESKIIPLPSWQWQFAQHANTLLTCLVTGRCLARLAEGSELGACVSFIVMNLIAMTSIHFFVPPARFNLTVLVEVTLALSCGAIWARRRRAVIL